MTPPNPPTGLTSSQEGCAAAIISIVMLPFIIVLDGWALSLMWGWFVAPVTGWAAIGVWEAAGLMAIKPIFSYRRSASDEKIEKEEGALHSIMSKVVTSVLATMLSLGIGWVLHLLVPTPLS